MFGTMVLSPGPAMVISRNRDGEVSPATRSGSARWPRIGPGSGRMRPSARARLDACYPWRTSRPTAAITGRPLVPLAGFSPDDARWACPSSSPRPCPERPGSDRSSGVPTSGKPFRFTRGCSATGLPSSREAPKVPPATSLCQSLFVCAPPIDLPSCPDNGSVVWSPQRDGCIVARKARR